MQARLAALVCALSLAAVGCRGDGAEADGDTPAPERPVSVDEGTATLSISGNLRQEHDLEFSEQRRRSLTGDRVGTLLIYTGEEGVRLQVGGSLREGENRNADLITIQVRLPEGTFVSTDAADCRIVVATLTEDAIDGEYACSGLTDGDLIVSARGTFTGTAAG